MQLLIVILQYYCQHSRSRCYLYSVAFIDECHAHVKYPVKRVTVTQRYNLTQDIIRELYNDTLSVIK